MKCTYLLLRFDRVLDEMIDAKLTPSVTSVLIYLSARQQLHVIPKMSVYYFNSSQQGSSWTRKRAVCRWCGTCSSRILMICAHISDSNRKVSIKPWDIWAGAWARCNKWYTVVWIQWCYPVLQYVQGEKHCCHFSRLMFPKWCVNLHLPPEA